MSKNLSHLTGRFGTKENLFETYVKKAEGSGTGTLSPEEMREQARKYVIGESTIFGAVSAYDFLQENNKGKKAYVCNGTACKMAGTQGKVTTALQKKYKPEEVGEMCCLGRCYENAAFAVEGVNYSGRDLDHLDTIAKPGPKVTSKIKSKIKPESKKGYVLASPMKAPVLTAEFSGIDKYYQTWQKALSLSPQAVLQEIKESELRGRGGAGFPAGLKWESCAQQKSEVKYIVCNADEGDPGAFSDRYLLEERPHSVLLGMMISGYVVGASWGILYIRAEYPEAVYIMEKAVEEIREAGFVGKNILGSGFSFDFKVVKGAGAYICGEETALLSSLEGLRPEVRVRPPFPTVSGLHGKPTIINNVETFACAPFIIEKGAQAFKNLGTEKSKGTKLLCLDGFFKHPGVVEVEMGTPLKDVIETIGGGFHSPVKAVQIGGPLGGVVPLHKTPELSIDFESFQKGGFLLGHGSLVSIPEPYSMVEYMQHLLAFTSHESCGKCFPCRLGSQRGAELLQKSLDEPGYKIDETLLNDLIETLELGSMCGLGGGVPMPLKNILQYFKEEIKPYLLGEASV